MNPSATQTETAQRARTVSSEVWLHDYTQYHVFGTPRENHNIVMPASQDMNVQHGGDTIFVPRGTELTIYRKFRDAAAGEVLVMFQLDREQITLRKGGGIVRRSLFG